MTKPVHLGTNLVEKNGIILSVNTLDTDRSRPIGVEQMSIKISKLLQASIMKIDPVHADPGLVREVELAREKAWHDAYLHGGIIN